MYQELQIKSLKTLKIKFLFKEIICNLFQIVINLIILLFSLNYYWTIFCLILYLGYIYNKNKNLFYGLIIIDLIVIISFIIHFFVIKDYQLDKFSGIVIKINYYDNYNKLIVKNKFIKCVVYDYNFLDIKIGDYIDVSGNNKIIESNRIFGSFNYQKYYYSQNNVSIIKAQTIEVYKKFNIYYLRRLMYQYITKTFDKLSSSYILGMILGDSSLIDEGSQEMIKINGISHLFAISGLHISLLVTIISKILKKIKVKEKNVENIICFILGIYIIITNFTVSILRASLMYLLNIINKRNKLKLKSIDIISLIFIVFIIINPYYIYNLSFILSFSASFIIILISQTMDVYHIKLNSFIELLFITIILQISTLPIVVNLNNNLNLLSFVTNGIFISLVSFIILPSTFFVLIFPIFKNIYKFIIISFSSLNDIFGKYLTININLPSFSKLEIVIYYLLIIILISCWFNKKSIKKMIYFGLIIFVGCYYNKINLNVNGNIYFLDIYEGDCTVIDLPMGKGLMVIDTGTRECSEVIEFLKRIGVRNIDYLVLTHNHEDHLGNASNIINQFNVNKIVISAYNNIVADCDKLIVKAGDQFNLNGYNFNVLSPKTESLTNENDNSLVLYTKLGNYKYLFLGDASIKIEDELIKYNLDVDCVKVAHHGSKTSTSNSFYKSIKPKYVFIETGRVTKYGFPHQETINVLRDYKVYRTDINYSIKVNFNKNRSIITSLK